MAAVGNASSVSYRRPFGFARFSGSWRWRFMRFPLLL
jgi:hypothetical protein